MKYVVKKIVAIMIVMTFVMGMVACDIKSTNIGENETDEKLKETMRIGTLKGPTGMGMAQLMSQSEQGEAALDYEFSVMGSPDELVGKIVSGEVDVAAVPTNLALTLYNRTEGQVQLAAVNTLGVLYVLENGNSIQEITDLVGKIVNASGKGASPDFIFRYILAQNNLTVDQDVMLDFKLQHAELAAALVAGDVEVALLPQPHVTTALMRNEDLRIALDITKEWGKVSEDVSKLAMGVVIVQKEFAKKHGETFDIFLDEYKDSVAFVNEQIEDAANLIEKYDILPNAAIAKNAIPYANIVYIDAQEAKPFLEDLYEMLFEFEPRAVGGKLADEAFYYNR